MSRKLLTREGCATVLVVAIAPRRSDLSLGLEGARCNARYLRDHGARVAMPQPRLRAMVEGLMREEESLRRKG